MTDTTFRCAYGEFSLQRRPLTPHLPLQAWDAVDEYLLALSADALATDIIAGNRNRILVVNDQFGALAVALHSANVCSWGDAFTAHLATRENLARNALTTEHLQLLPATQMPQTAFDIVLWRIPKTVALFQQQAAALHARLDRNTAVFAAGMQKHLPQQTLALLQTIGAVTVLPARKKARAYAIALDAAAPQPTPLDDKAIALPELGLSLHGDANVFARDKFDIGARFFIEQFARLPRARRIADLGCGNGVLGILAKCRQPDADIVFFDESYQAIAAAERNYARNGLLATYGPAQFFVDDVFAHYQGEAFDLILCNPPFHQSHVVGDHIAKQMFAQSKHQLRPGGELWIVGNRHLDYHLKLKQLFGNCRQIAANPKFVVLAARKST